MNPGSNLEHVRQLFDDSNLRVSESRTLPPWCYTSPEFFDFEIDALFRHEWLCVGRIDHIPTPGDFYTLTIADEPLIIVRDNESTIRAMSAVCQHRAHLVANGSGNCQAFKCPYHHWTYATDGALLSAPTMRQTPGFDRTDYRLPSIRVELWEGFIFVNFDEDAAPLSPKLEKLRIFTENFRLGDANSAPMTLVESCPWNWKVQVDNSNDAYHASRLHTFAHSYFPSDNFEYIPWDRDDGAIIRPHRFTHEDGSFNKTAKAIMPIFQNLTRKERSRAIFVVVPPNMTIGFTCDVVFYFFISPQTVETSSFHIGYLFAPESSEMPDFAERVDEMNAGIQDFVVQDIEARTLVQRGLRSAFARTSHMSHQEQTLADYARWLVDRYERKLSEGLAGSGPVVVSRS